MTATPTFAPVPGILRGSVLLPRLNVLFRTPDHYRIRCPRNVLRHLFWLPVMPSVAESVAGLVTRTGCKLYPRANGWWDLMGYAADHSDIEADLDTLSRIARHEAGHAYILAQRKVEQEARAAMFNAAMDHVVNTSLFGDQP